MKKSCFSSEGDIFLPIKPRDLPGGSVSGLGWNGLRHRNFLNGNRRMWGSVSTCLLPIALHKRKMRVLPQKRDASGIVDSNIFTCLWLFQFVRNSELAPCCFSQQVRKGIFVFSWKFSFPFEYPWFAFAYPGVGAEGTSFSESKAFSTTTRSLILDPWSL